MFNIKFTENAIGDLRYLKKNAQSLIMDGIKKQLRYEPLIETTNRKPLNPNQLSKWELRIGKHRIFYDIDSEMKDIKIKAVGWKEGNRLLIRGKGFQL